MKKNLNKFVAVDFDDTKTISSEVFSIKYFSLKEKLWKKKTFKVQKKYARLVATQNFVCKGEIINQGNKGAYVAIKGTHPKIKLGENSWVQGSFMGTTEHNSFVDKNVKIGNNSLVGMCVKLNSGVVIGDKCHIGSDSKIGKNNIFGHGTSTSEIITGPNLLVGDGTTIGIKNLNGTTAIGATNYVGLTPNYFKHYWWKKGIEPIHLGKHKLSKREFFERFIKDKYYKLLTTRIGANVQLDKGCFIQPGAVIGDGAKVGYQVQLGCKKEIDNNKIIENNTKIL